ncbi:MAG: two-component regulator propeller domain-containing protein [Opitutaceae bacterium]
MKSEKGIDLIRDIYRSEDGYVWVGTNFQGLVRFDGYSTKWYKANSENPKSISSNAINELAEDHDGNLWVATVSGLEKLDRKTDTFTRYRHNPKDPNSLADNTVGSLHIDDNGTLWVLTNLALHRYVPDSDNFIRCHEYEGPEPPPKYYKMECDSDGVFWISALQKNGLYKFNPSTGNINFYPYTGEIPTTWGRQSIELDPDGRTLWMTVHQLGLLRFDKIDHTFFRYPIDPLQTGKGVTSTEVNDLIHIDQDTLAVCVAHGGICILDKKNDQFTYITEKSDGVAGLTSNGAFSFHKDNEGILWLGTSRGGLFYNNPGHYSFETYQNESLKGSIVGTIFEDIDGLVWVGTGGYGINIFNRDTKKFRVINTENSNLSSNVIRSFSKDVDGNIWIATWNRGLNLYDKSTQEVTPIQYPNALKKVISERDQIWRFHIDTAGRFWIITNSSTLLLDNQLNIQNTFFNTTGGEFRNGMLYQFDEAAVYFSNNSGIFSYDESTSQMIPFILGIQAIQVARDLNGYFYIATRTQGIYILDAEGNILRTLTTEDGLSDNSIRAIELTKEGTLWAGTMHGLSRINLKDYSVSSFYEKDGLQGNSYFMQSSTTLKDGTLAFGGTRGVSFWKPHDTKIRQFDAPVYIQNIQISNRNADLNELLIDRDNGTQEVEIDWPSKMVRFGFSAVGFTYPENIRYAYMLEGFDDDWVYTDSQSRVATYTNLSPGNYKLVIKASDDKGSVTPNTATLHLKVIPPFWMSAWFYALLILLLAIAIHYYLRHRDKKLEIEQEKLLKEVAERSQLIDQITEAKNQAVHSDRLKSQFLANMSHEIRTPMNAIIGFSELLADDHFSAEERKSFLESITNGADSLLRLIEDILDISMIEANQLKIKLHDFSLVDLLNKTHSSFIVFQPSDTVELKYTPPPPELSNAVLHSDSQRLRQIITNLVNNALKFTYSGTVELGCRSEKDTVVIYVKDTGDGIDAAEVDAIFSEFVRLERHDQAAVRGVGLGLAISKRLADLLDYKLEVESTKGVGSEFRLVIPKKNVSIDTGAHIDVSPSLESTDTLQYNWEKQTILIVEDENSNFQYLQSVLKNTSIQIEWAKNGKEAIECIREGDTVYDLVLMDIKMPVMDGYEAITVLKVLHPKLIVVAQTAYAMQEDMSKCLEAGFDDYLSKPILPNTLIHTIAKYIKT